MMKTWKKIIKHCNKCNEPFWVGQNIAWNTKYCIPCRKEHNRERDRGYSKVWYAKHPEKHVKHSEKQREYRRKYRRKHLEIQKKYSKKVVLLLPDSRVKGVLMGSTGIPRHLITIELVREQRELIFLNRHIRQIRKELDYE